MNSTVKTLTDALTPGITFDVPDATVIAPDQPMRIKVTYLADAGSAAVDTNSVFETPVLTHMDLKKTPISQNGFDTFQRDTVAGTLSAYINVQIDTDAVSGVIPTLTVTYGTDPSTLKTATLTLTGTDRDQFSERGFSPVVHGNFIKDLNPAAAGVIPDLSTNGYVRVRVNAVDAVGNAIPHFQIPLWAETNFLKVRMFPVDAYAIENEILPVLGGSVFFINTDDNGSRELYVFVGSVPAGGSVNSSTMDLQVNIRGLAVENASNQVLIVAGKITKPKSDAPIIPDLDGDTLDPDLSDDPDFTVVIPAYKDHKPNDAIYVLAKDANGKDTYLGHKRVSSSYKWGVSPLLNVPFNAFPTVGDYYVYYYAADTGGNATQSADLHVNLVNQVPNAPIEGFKKFTHPVEVWTAFGLEVVSPPGNVNEYAALGGLEIRVPVKLTDPTYVDKGDSVMVTMRTDGWSAAGVKKAKTFNYYPIAAVTDADIAQGYISVNVDATDLSGYDSDPKGHPGSITFEYSVGDDSSVAWYGQIDTVAPGESK